MLSYKIKYIKILLAQVIFLLAVIIVKNIVYGWACCFKENVPSERLIRSIGVEFQQEGTFYSPNDREYESLEFRMKLLM